MCIYIYIPIYIPIQQNPKALETLKLKPGISTNGRSPLRGSTGLGVVVDGLGGRDEGLG